MAVVRMVARKASAGYAVIENSILDDWKVGFVFGEDCMKDQPGYNIAVVESVKLDLKNERHDQQIVTYALK